MTCIEMESFLVSRGSSVEYLYGQLSRLPSWLLVLVFSIVIKCVPFSILSMSTPWEWAPHHFLPPLLPYYPYLFLRWVSLPFRPLRHVGSNDMNFWNYPLFARKLCWVPLRAIEPPSELALGPYIQHHYQICTVLYSFWCVRLENGRLIIFSFLSFLITILCFSVKYLYGQLSRLTNWKGGAHLLQLNAFCGANTSGSCTFPQYTHSKGQLCLSCSVSVTSLANLHVDTNWGSPVGCHLCSQAVVIIYFWYWA